ncbi:glycosyltransferase [Candidatus Peregrinibacteria bacterium]|nr:glycosyltransferase [Candidatus Peregrinibacteria bacterium]
MKVLLVNDTFPPDINGSAYFTHRLATSLMTRGHKVLAIAPSRTFHDEPSVRNGVSVFGVWSFPIIHYTNFRVPFPIFIKDALRKVIQEFAPDIVHLQGHSILGRTVMTIARELHVGVMGTNHFMPENLVHYLHLPTTFEDKIKKWAWSDCRRIFEKLDCVTTPTQTAADLMKKFGFSKPILALSNGIDLQRFHPGNDGEFLKKRYALTDKPTLLYVGRLDKEKNVDLILRALAKIAPETAPHFLIAGKGFEEKNLKKLAHELGLENRVTFAGFVPDEDLPFLYRISHAFIIAGTAELQSLVTMEAMATGLPIIGVNATALPELIHDGKNGYLFAPGDIEGLISCIQRLFKVSNPRQQMGAESLKLIQAHDINKIMATFESLYTSLSQPNKNS